FQVLREEHIETLQKLISVPKEKITVIGNWSRFEGHAKSLPEEKIIICPGAINADKNQSLLVDAFAEVSDGFPDWQVHIYGRGKTNDETALLRRIKTKGLMDRILLKGYAELSAPYAKCAFVAFPSKTEGFGMVILDAAMFKKAALTIRDWIGCGESVSPSGFTEALRRLMSDADHRHNLGERSYEHCKMHYSRKMILDKWECLLAGMTA
ncbi:MAG: glycosyltransferase, partial [Kiritimatiellae bacterium]|nr:glycosyltransferase [Kiritimatiellia bacterium]